MAEKLGKDEDRPKRLKAIADSVAENCDTLHNLHKDESLKYAYSRDTFHALANKFDGISDSPKLADVEDSLRKFKGFVEAREAEARSIPVDISAATHVVSTAATSVVFFTKVNEEQDRQSVGISFPEPFKEWNSKKDDAYAAKLSKLDAELGKVYASVWHEFYGGTGSSERAALLAMRQSFDHLFRLLAPDGDVRESDCFQVKAGDQPNAVHRRERIEFALQTRIKDVQVRELLRAETPNMLDSYHDLNKLHAQGNIDRANTEKVLIAMQKLIEQWVDALNL